MNFEISLSPFQQRLAALGLFAIPLLLAVIWLGSLFSDLAEHHQQVSLLERERANYRALVENAPAWQREVDAYQRASAGASLFYEGNQLAGAGPQLVNTLSDLVKKNGGTILHANLDAADPADGEGAMRADVAFEADIADLTKILHAVRDARPLLLTRQLMVQRQDQPANTGPTHLAVQLAVIGYARLP